MPDVARGVREAAAAETTTAPEIGGGRSAVWLGEFASAIAEAASELGAGDDAQPKAARIAKNDVGEVGWCMEIRESLVQLRGSRKDDSFSVARTSSRFLGKLCAAASQGKTYRWGYG